MPRRNKQSAAHGSGPRPIWSGTVSFGLVSVPDNLFPATRNQHVGMRMLAQDGVPLRRRYVCGAEGIELERSDIVRGRPVEGGFIELEDEEIDAITPRKSRDLEVERFVAFEQVDRLLFERVYVLTPASGTSKPYRLLARVLEESSLAGIGTFVLRAREHLSAVVARSGVLILITLRFAEEVRGSADIDLRMDVKPARKEVAALREQLEAIAEQELDRDELRDRQRL